MKTAVAAGLTAAVLFAGLPVIVAASGADPDAATCGAEEPLDRPVAAEPAAAPAGLVAGPSPRVVVAHQTDLATAVGAGRGVGTPAPGTVIAPPAARQGPWNQTSILVSGSPCGCPGRLVPAASGVDGVDTAARAALRAGWTDRDAVVAVAIAGAESRYRHDAANPHSSARGMWQTMMRYHTAKYHGESWSDPYANARVAHTIWADAHSWSPWTTYTSGAYRSHLREATVAVANILGGAHTVSAVHTRPVDPVSGLRPITIKAEHYIRSTLRFAGTVYGYAHRKIAGTNRWSEHSRGLALDLMTTDLSVGQPIADYFSGRGAAPWHVHNVIWQDRIWTSEGQRWKPYGDHGSATLNHMDHVHVDFHDVLAAGLPATPLAPTPTTCLNTVSALTGISGGGVMTVGGRVMSSPGTAQRTGGRYFALATFNLHGASHTGTASTLARLPEAVTVLNRHHVDVVGFQEMQPVQARAFDRLAGGTFARFSAPHDTDNSIAWRTAAWAFVSGRLLSVPYFDGHHRLMPVVRLWSTQTGEVATFLNVHNPANTSRYGNQSHWRAAALRVEIPFLNATAAGGPVYWTGDMNDHHFKSSLAGRSVMAGGSADTYGRIDWILGSPGHRPLSVTTDDSPLVDATTDHPFVVARIAG